MCACSRSFSSCIQPLGWKNKAHWRPPFFSEKSGIDRRKICIFQGSCRCRVRLWDRGSICICFLRDSSFQSIAFCRPSWRAQVWWLVSWWSGQRGSWTHTCSFPCRSGCRDSSTYQHGVCHTCQNTYWLQSIVQDRNSLLSKAHFLASNTLKIPCCTWVDDYNYDTIKIEGLSHIITGK